MRRIDFEGLKNGDLVRLEFSNNRDHVVVSVNGDMISTSPINDNKITYCNHYTDITYVGPKISKANIDKKNKIIEYFNDFAKDCKSCPFREECRNTYSQTRRWTTSAINLCDALKMTHIDYS